MLQPTVLDLMEYANDAAAQAAFVTNGTQLDQVPTMTSNTNPSGVASADLEYNATYAAWKAFDKDVGYWSTTALGALPHWVEYDFGAGLTRIITKYTIKSSTNADRRFDPTDWLYQGSNNDVDWTTVDTRTGIAFSAASETQTFLVATPGSYRYYRVYVTANYDAGFVRTMLGEITMMEAWTLQDYSEATIKQEGSYALKGIALITDSLNKTLTRTVSPTINLTDKTIIKFDIRASRTGANIKIGIHDSGGTTTEITPTIAAVDTWQTVVWDISAVSNANKDVIDSIVVTIVNADAENTFYIDNMFADVIQNFLIHRGRDRFRMEGISLGN